jgi:hypothetical protein
VQQDQEDHHERRTDANDDECGIEDHGRPA